MRITPNINPAELATVGENLHRTPSPSNHAIRGAHYLAFVHDPVFWPNIHQGEVYAQEVVIEVDGKQYEQEDIEPSIFTGNSTVTIVAGEVFEFYTRLHTLQDHYEAWAEARRNGQA